MTHAPKKIALAYSGGLDTSVMIPWLLEHHPGCEVHAIVGDVGQDPAELVGIEDKAIASGAVHCEVADLTRTFLEEYAFPMAISGAVYEGRYLLGTSIARPIIAKAQVDYARRMGCDAVCHGCTGKGNDQVRFESTFAALAPELEIIAPWRHWEIRSREEALQYLAARGIACSASLEKIYSRDDNIWHISHEGGELEDPWNPPPDDMWTRTVDPLHAPDAPGVVTIRFEAGRPVTLDGEPLGAVELLTELNRRGGEHGVGRIDIVENRLVGMKSRGCYETPGGTILMEALRGLEELVLDRRTLRLRERLAHDFSDLVYDGQWWTPAREAMMASFASIAGRLDGEVEVRLSKGTAVTTRRRSPNSLYSESFATFGADEVYDQSHAEGFIRLFSLPSRIAAMQSANGSETAEAAAEGAGS
ncbi:MAG: argininosuccinate synthase [Planctomycetes bacterium]|nr:argininosuccinate synthase [Phycisphaerae bacterium]MCP3858040.1 argininosuccinate synthase [Phycisphaeraceae bacterium]MCP3902085.1 argininosuccinate synthase [Planctomycetota bacterium]MCP4068479.1 argininosuccinate synthase [Phycisphaeraceae bacterium]MCP4797531.1 argininosuccinate synthase [Phycisphaeraceae bacterium]